jgi:diguanylate cyclase (GGDEF)-like protein
MMERIFQAFIPEDIEKDIIKSAYARNLIAACIISIFAALGYAGLYYYLKFYTGAYVILSNEIILLATLFIVKYFRSVFIASMVFITSLVVVLFWITYNLGGIYSATTYWLVLPPLIATYIGGMRFGYLWCLITLCVISIFYFLEYTHYQFSISPISDPLFFLYVSMCGLDLVILWFIYFYETNIKKNLQKLRTIAYSDLLTGLPNRMAYRDTLEAVIVNSVRNKENFSIIYINIDNFKKINAIFGQDIGNILLFDIPQRIKRHMPNATTLARIGGDEFKMIIEGNYSEEEIDEIGNVIQATLKIPFRLKNHEIKISASIGIATYLHDHTDSINIDRYVDIALTKAKNLGGNNYQYFTKKLAEESALQIAIERSLPDAIANRELHLNFQLLFDAKNQTRITSFEVLLRWRSNTLGVISPAIFIPIAEKIDLISQLDEWVLKEACKIYMVWHAANLVSVDIPFAVNVSPQQLYDDNFLSSIEMALHESGVSPPNLILELTETSIINDQDRVIKILQSLKQMGVRTVIDDFGAGQTSLSYLTTLPVSGLKIDKSFTDTLLIENSNHGIVIQSMIELAHKLNLKVVSEGVETAEQLEYLKNINCDFIQGFYLSRPLDVMAMQNYLEEYKRKIKAK